MSIIQVVQKMWQKEQEACLMWGFPAHPESVSKKRGRGGEKESAFPARFCIWDGEACVKALDAPGRSPVGGASEMAQWTKAMAPPNPTP